MKLYKRLELLIWISIVVVICVTFLLGGSNTYTPPQPQEFITDYKTKAIDTMLEALKFAYTAGQIAEARVCPCYDVEVSSDADKIFLRVDRSRCENED